MRCLVGHLLLLLQNATTHSLDELQLCKVSKPYSTWGNTGQGSLEHMLSTVLSCKAIISVLLVSHPHVQQKQRQAGDDY